MEENQTKVCPNCKRDIPTDNYLIHSVHCAKNIRVCPVCKEPVPATELTEHHEKMHKLLPCKKCGEAVCGADLEDHIRDSCALTAATCRHCQLELPRKEMPAHESYCGARTEQCPDCGEYVMIKYRQIHLDSNHGFLKLDDDPNPVPRNESRSSATDNPILQAVLNSAFVNLSPASRPNFNNRVTERAAKNINVPKSARTPSGSNRPQFNYTPSINEHSPGPSGLSVSRSSLQSSQNRSNSNGERIRPEYSDSRDDIHRKLFRTSPPSNTGAVPRSIGVNNNVESRKSNVSKRTNDQPQINMAVEASNKVDKNLSANRERSAVPFSPDDGPSTLTRVAQHRGAIKKRQAPRPPSGSQNASTRDLTYWSATARFQDEEKQREEQSALNAARGLPPVLNPAAKLEKLRKIDALHNRETNEEFQRKAKSVPNKNINNFSNWKPMTNDEFMNRFEKLRLKNENRERERINQAKDQSENRFNEIKRDLRELRRGLNEVTAPYNASSVNNFGVELEMPLSPRSKLLDMCKLNAIEREERPDDMDVELPCEFCDEPVAASRLVLHQTGCRPDLARYSPRSPPLGARDPRSPSPTPEDDPVIPCEFCALSLPVYLIAAHQMNCGMLRNRDDSIEMMD